MKAGASPRTRRAQTREDRVALGVDADEIRAAYRTGDALAWGLAAADLRARMRADRRVRAGAR